jgi:hypothetical protein
MKQHQLQELVRLITRQVLKEISVGSGTDAEETNSVKTDTVSVDDLSSAEQAKLRREKDITRRDQIKQKEKQLDVAKKKAEFQKQEIDQVKRFEIPTLQKSIQADKGAKI